MAQCSGFLLAENVEPCLSSQFVSLFNHPDFGPPDNRLTDALFGRSTQILASSLAGGNDAGFNPLYRIGGPCSIQLALKLQF
jgi:hypothetical protein